METSIVHHRPPTNARMQNIGQRRGHRYKHSSVSTQHQIFLEPPPRAPLAIPPSLPIPTVKEAWHSLSKEQTTRMSWCVCHALVAAYVLHSAAGSLALTALSHLVFFDAISATICVVVDVFCNFEVWKRSSIRHPFGYNISTPRSPSKTNTSQTRAGRSPRWFCHVCLPPFHGLRPGFP